MRRIYVAVVCMLVTACYGQKTKQAAGDGSIGFDIHRYAAQMTEMPYERKNMGDVTLTEYALVDLDGDDHPELWVRGDNNYQAFYVVKGDSVEMIAYADGATDLTFHKNAVSWSAYYSPGQWWKGASVLKDSHVVSNYDAMGEFEMQSEETVWEEYWLDGKESTSEACDQFQERIGDMVDEPVADWHGIVPVITCTTEPD